MKRYLITTADERSWKFDRPVLFLGEWCRRYDRTAVWSKMDAEVAAPFGLEHPQRWQDLEYVQSTATELLVEVAAVLNDFHRVRHSARYWNIVLGHWLQRYVAVVFNRYHTIERALATHEVSGTTVLDVGNVNLATKTSAEFAPACDSDSWNHAMFARVLRDRSDVALIASDLPPADHRASTREDAGPGLLSRGKRAGRMVGTRIARAFVRESDAFIITSYLPFAEEAKLQIALGQAPQLWRSPPFETVEPDAGVRGGISLPARAATQFEKFLREQLFQVIPTCYLEGYQRLVSTAESQPWPRRPRFIFTSNSFDTDEICKAWTAAQAEQGTPYFVGQHGNNNGTLKGTQNWPERITADRFITWGWTDGSGKTVPAFLFKTVRDRAGEFDKTGGLLLIEVALLHRVTAADLYYEFGLYQEDQFHFVEALPRRLRERLTVRLHGAVKPDWHERMRWRDRSPETRIDSGRASIRRLTSQSRLVVHSYDSTGLLETLSLNTPTIAFWRGGLNHLLPEAKQHYELLRSAGIVLDSPVAAAKHAALHWDDIAEWWQSRGVQDARREFCEVYARKTERPVRALKKILATHAVRCRRT